MEQQKEIHRGLDVCGRIKQCKHKKQCLVCMLRENDP